jgi:1-acyl-sn-glycerol-3-phosphate acyltransferase
MGGIPVDRSSSNNFVAQIVDAFNRSQALVIAIAPEGTRSLVPYWRTGFYFMAQEAQVPIAFGYIDYHRKTLGIHPGIQPSGDLPADMEHIRHFYYETVHFYQSGARNPVKSKSHELQQPGPTISANMAIRMQGLITCQRPAAVP